MNVTASIQGVSPLLQHRFTEKAGSPDATRNMLVAERTPRERAEDVTYKDALGRYFFPGPAILRLLREAGANHKMKGSRRAVKSLVPAAVMVPDEAILIRRGGVPHTEFEVDSRPVVIPATKGRIIQHRPRWDQWDAEFGLEIDPEVLPVEMVHQLLEEGGRRLGIGDFRPEKGGPFGRFCVVKWKLG